MDTEATGLAPDDEVWEFAGHRHEPDGTIHELHLFIDHDHSKAEKLPHEFRKDWTERFPKNGDATPTDEAARQIQAFTEGAHILGAVPNFDTEKLAKMIRDYGLKPRWHYHLLDIENLIVGYFLGRGELIDPPYKSDDLSLRIGVDPTHFNRHTAMGDVLWCEAQWDALRWIRP
jgi:DNA polymerase III epsilon subunit-like protein